MPLWAMAKACQDGLAPRPGSAKVLVRRMGTVLACVRPAGVTTVPMNVSTPSASGGAIAAAASGVAVMAAIVAIRSVLAGDQLGDEPIEEAVEWCFARRPDDEFRQSRVDVGFDLPVQLLPAGGDQRGGMGFWTTAAGRRDQLRGQLAVGDGQRNAEVIGVDAPARLRRGPPAPLPPRP